MRFGVSAGPFWISTGERGRHPRKGDDTTLVILLSVVVFVAVLLGQGGHHGLMVGWLIFCAVAALVALVQYFRAP